MGKKKLSSVEEAKRLNEEHVINHILGIRDFVSWTTPEFEPDSEDGDDPQEIEVWHLGARYMNLDPASGTKCPCGYKFQ